MKIYKRKIMTGVITLIATVAAIGFYRLTEDGAPAPAIAHAPSAAPAAAETTGKTEYVAPDQPLMAAPRVYRSDGPATDSNKPKPGVPVPITVTGIVHYNGNLATLAAEDGKVYSTPINSADAKSLQSGCEDTDRCSVTMMPGSGQTMKVLTALRAQANDLNEHQQP